MATPETELIITPEVTMNDLRRMQRQMEKTFDNIADYAQKQLAQDLEKGSKKGLVKGFRDAITKSQGFKFSQQRLKEGGSHIKSMVAGGILAGIAVAGGRADEVLNERVEGLQSIKRQAGALGISEGETLRLQTVLQASGIEEGEIEPTLTAFSQLLAQAKTGDDKTLSNFTQYGTTEDSLRAFLISLGKESKEDRVADLQKVFGEDASAKIGTLAGVDILDKINELKKLGVNLDVDYLNDKFLKADNTLKAKSQADAVVRYQTQMHSIDSTSPTMVNKQEQIRLKRIEMDDQLLRSYSTLAEGQISLEKTILSLTSVVNSIIPYLEPAFKALSNGADGIVGFLNNPQGWVGQKLDGIKQAIKEVKLF